MFKAIRILLLLLVLIFVAGTTWLTQARSTDWEDTLWIRVYPMNGDGSELSQRYVDTLDIRQFAGTEEFFAKEVAKYGRDLARPVRVELGKPVTGQPPALPPATSVFQIMWWSMRVRWWAGSVTSGDDGPRPDVRMFVRYFDPDTDLNLDNSVGLQKGMIGIVNAYASRRQEGTNNVIIAHEFLHTLGATDKYDTATGLPAYPDGYAEPAREPRYPQRYAEIMGGRIPLADDDATVPQNLDYALIGPQTAREIRLIE
ncbi:MAG: hypothetical protein WD001_01050 [Woeseia sp.]